MPAVFEYQHTVRPEEIDVQGHANNVVYVDWMQRAAMAHSAAQGWPGERYRQAGFSWVVRSHAIVYRRPALLADEIVVRTWVATMRKVTSLRRYEMLRVGDGALLATAETNWAFVCSATGSPTRVPAELAAAFELVER